MSVEFQLQDDEKIVKDIKPLPILKWYFFSIDILGCGILIIFLSIYLFLLFSTKPPSSVIYFVSYLIVLFIIPTIILILYLVANRTYKMQHYWITNKRILYKRGFLGYKISSIPLERISDVMISRSFIERMFGFGSILIQSLAGQLTPNQMHGAEGSLIAVPDPEGLQKLIFDLVKIKRKEEKLSF
jgi:uncharacterized membrane protein YdbT with pleckstrin-like domain